MSFGFVEATGPILEKAIAAAAGAAIGYLLNYAREKMETPYAFTDADTLLESCRKHQDNETCQRDRRCRWDSADKECQPILGLTNIGVSYPSKYQTHLQTSIDLSLWSRLMKMEAQIFPHCLVISTVSKGELRVHVGGVHCTAFLSPNNYAGISEEMFRDLARRTFAIGKIEYEWFENPRDQDIFRYCRWKEDTSHATGFFLFRSKPGQPWRMNYIDSNDFGSSHSHAEAVAQKVWEILNKALTVHKMALKQGIWYKGLKIHKCPSRQNGICYVNLCLNLMALRKKVREGQRPRTGYNLVRMLEDLDQSRSRKEVLPELLERPVLSSGSSEENLFQRIARRFTLR